MFYAVFTYFSFYLGIGCRGGGGGGQTGLVQNLLMQVLSLYGSKIEVFETFFLII